MSSFFDTPFTADASQANTGGDYSPIPEGIYKLVVEKAHVKKTQAGNDMLSAQYAVCEGEYEGRKVFGNFNIEHSKPDVVAIARKELHALLILSGLKEITSPDELVGAEFTAKVVVKKRKDTGELNNSVLLSLPKADAAPIVVIDEPATPVAKPTVSTVKPSNKSAW